MRHQSCPRVPTRFSIVDVLCPAGFRLVSRHERRAENMNVAKTAAIHGDLDQSKREESRLAIPLRSPTSGASVVLGVMDPGHRDQMVASRAFGVWLIVYNPSPGVVSSVCCLLSKPWGSCFWSLQHMSELLLVVLHPPPLQKIITHLVLQSDPD